MEAEEDTKNTPSLAATEDEELPDKFPLDDSKSLAVENDMDYFRSMIKWMLRQGQGEALFSLGVDKKEACVGMSEADLEKAKANLASICSELGCEYKQVTENRTGKSGKAADFLLRESNAERYSDIRIAVCGNVDSGKSTMVGVLTSGKLDNGRGSARQTCFNFKHEKESGRTSSIGEAMLGFDVKGECLNQPVDHKVDWGEIMEKSFKVVTFFDLAGHEKYLKTTVGGMTGNMPDYCFLLIGANMGITRMTKEHMGLALALKIPIVIVLTKIDMCPDNVKKQTLNDIHQLLKLRSVRKLPVHATRSDEEFIKAVRTSTQDRVVPIFEVSSVTGQNLDSLRKYLNLIPPRIPWEKLRDCPAEVSIDQTWFVSGVGTVVGGTVTGGVVTAGSTLLLGPDSLGHFQPVMVKSIHSKRVPVKYVVAGQSAGFALKKIKRSAIRKGMVLVDPKTNPKATWVFEADVAVLYHSTTIHLNYQPVVQCMTIRQAAKIIEIQQKEVLRTGDRAKVKFKFMFRPEYLKPNMRLIFREGRCKGIGVISAVGLEEETSASEAREAPTATTTGGNAGGGSSNKAGKKQTTTITTTAAGQSKKGTGTKGR